MTDPTCYRVLHREHYFSSLSLKWNLLQKLAVVVALLLFLWTPILLFGVVQGDIISFKTFEFLDIKVAALFLINLLWFYGNLFSRRKRNTMQVRTSGVLRKVTAHGKWVLLSLEHGSEQKPLSLRVKRANLGGDLVVGHCYQFDYLERGSKTPTLYGIDGRALTMSRRPFQFSAQSDSQASPKAVDRVVSRWLHGILSCYLVLVVVYAWLEADREMIAFVNNYRHLPVHQLEQADDWRADLEVGQRVYIGSSNHCLLTGEFGDWLRFCRYLQSSELGSWEDVSTDLLEFSSNSAIRLYLPVAEYDRLVSFNEDRDPQSRLRAFNRPLLAGAARYLQPYCELAAEHCRPLKARLLGFWHDYHQICSSSNCPNDLASTRDANWQGILDYDGGVEASVAFAPNEERMLDAEIDALQQALFDVQVQQWLEFPRAAISAYISVEDGMLLVGPDELHSQLVKLNFGHEMGVSQYLTLYHSMRDYRFRGAYAVVTDVLQTENGWNLQLNLSDFEDEVIMVVSLIFTWVIIIALAVYHLMGLLGLFACMAGHLEKRKARNTKHSYS